MEICICQQFASVRAVHSLLSGFHSRLIGHTYFPQEQLYTIYIYIHSSSDIIPTYSAEIHSSAQSGVPPPVSSGSSQAKEMLLVVVFVTTTLRGTPGNLRVWDISI